MIRNQPLVEYKLNVKLLFIYLIISCFFIINLSGLCSKTVEKNVCKTYVETLFEEKLQLSKKRKSPQSLYLRGFASYLPQHCLYLRPLPHGKILQFLCNKLLLFCNIFLNICNKLQLNSYNLPINLSKI